MREGGRVGCEMQKKKKVFLKKMFISLYKKNLSETNISIDLSQWHLSNTNEDIIFLMKINKIFITLR